MRAWLIAFLAAAFGAASAAGAVETSKTDGRFAKKSCKYGSYVDSRGKRRCRRYPRPPRGSHAG
ncbi:MAG: hypothetical protein ACR2PA_14565 [Hyphomicrobiaceae bacterium]